MRKVIVDEWMSLDGVVQAPGAADEDRSGGFKRGGWHLRYFDQVSQEQALKNIVEAGAFLLGRRTYEIFASYWPNAPDEERVADPLNTKPKYVASTTLTEPLECQYSKLLQSDIPEALAALKQEQGRRPACDRQHGVGADADRAGSGRRTGTAAGRRSPESCSSGSADCPASNGSAGKSTSDRFSSDSPGQREEP
ncbi:MAG: dihydrofolate reductase family protein [Gaiellaceae bacterium]